MISYSSNWMGPVSTKWYEDRNIPFSIIKKVSKISGREYEHKVFKAHFSCGRIDVYGLPEDEYYAGMTEYGLLPMLTQDWNKLQDWLDELQTETLLPYKELISQFEKDYGKAISWAADKTEKNDE
jgi:hypothetical protein